MARVKRKAEEVRAPRDADEANQMLARLGEIQRQQSLIQAALDEATAGVKAKAEAQAQPLAAEVQQLTRGLQLWAEANREALTQGGKTKTVELGAGRICWRQRPPSVRITGLDAVMAAVRRLKLTQFLRTKVELNKEAMLADPEKAATIPGVSIGSAGEEFVVEPVALPLAGAVAA